MDPTEHDRRLQEVLQRGEENLRVIQLAKNWCGHLEVERSQFGGVGIPEQMTGLPISAREFKCPYSTPSHTVTMDVAAAAISFYDNNCVGCEHRIPVGLPNLLELVQLRDDEIRKRDEAKAAAAAQERTALEARDERRSRASQDATEVQKGFIQLIQDLDHEPAAEKGRRLVEVARAAPEHFSQSLRDLLYDLLVPGGGTRVDAAVGALAATEPDKPGLARVLGLLLDRGESTFRVVETLTGMIEHVPADDLPKALPSFMMVATPAAHSIGVPFTARGPDARPLLRAFQQHPKVVTDCVIRALRSSNPWQRRRAAYSAGDLVRFEPALVGELSADLVRSVLLLDDDSAHPRSAAQEALAEALMVAPRAVDKAVRKVMGTSNEIDRALLFGVFERLLRLNRDPLSPETLQVCVEHIVQALSNPEEQERLREGVQALKYLAQQAPALVAEHTTQILGAAAILAERMDADPPQELIETRLPAGLRALEVENRRHAMYYALSGIVEELLGLAPQFPEEIATPALDLLDRLGEDHDRLKAALVRGMGKMGRQNKGLRMALPGLYLGMMHTSPLVRAAAAQAYGEVSQRFADDLPELAHEAFLLLLRDPFLIVHKAAVRALDRGDVPDNYRLKALQLVLLVVGLYRRDHSDDTFLADALEVLVYLYREEERTDRVMRFVIGTFRSMDPNAAWRKLQHMRVVRNAPGAGECLLNILTHSQLYSFSIDDVAEEIRRLPEEEISENAQRIAQVAAAAQEAARGEGNPSLQLLDGLSRAQRWEEASTLVSKWMDDDYFQEWPGAGEAVERFGIAIGVERSIANRAAAALTEALGRWEKAMGE